MKTLCAILLLSLAAASAFAQKGPIDELGFHPEKLYDFSETDSVSLFNGNLMVTLPIGIRYSVSSTLSYQLNLVYNGKTIDMETWCEDPFNTGCTGTAQKAKSYPNLGANAGNGWRLSMGRLLPPVDTGRQYDSFDDPSWVYEGPSGDEHALTPYGYVTPSPDLLSGLRLHVVDSTTREVEFGSGEVHKFVLENGVWRLKQIRDRFGNYVNITYTYTYDGLHETSWSLDDSAGRHHVVTFQYYPGMADGWSRGQQVTSIDLQGYNSGRAVYQVCYNADCTYNSSSAVPFLTSLRQPDGTQYNFTTQTTAGNALAQIRYPTGATVDYTYGYYGIPAQDGVCGVSQAFPAVASRTVKDGSTTRRWDYTQQLGSMVDVTPYTYDPCGTNDNRLYGPFYWSRTSVIAPLDSSNHRVRTDHYFSAFADARVDSTANDGFTVNAPLPAQGVERYGHSGAIGVPPPEARKPAVVPYVADIDATDDTVHPDTFRTLATETYADCDAAGDCTYGKLLRTTYDRYVGGVAPKPIGGRGLDTAQLISSRTVYANGRWPQSPNDPPNEAPCGTSTPCYTQITYSDDNGAAQFRTTTTESNFPNASTTTTTTQYPTWTAADLDDMNRPWLLDLYTEKTRSEGGGTAREAFCFDGNTGALLRHRVLADASSGPHDIVHVYTYDARGNVQFQSDYGGDVQTLDTTSPLCSMPLPSPWYKIENGYTGGTLATSRYYDRSTGAPLGFLSLDRSVDPSTGVVTAARDTAGAGTAYGYSLMPPRLTSMTAPWGATTSYVYTNATGYAGSAWTPAKVVATTTGNGTADTIKAEYMLDGLGRPQRESHLGADNQWSATETAYDEAGRVAWKSQPESTGPYPPSGPLAAAHKTLFKYDPFGQITTMTMPDGKTVSHAYTGARLHRKTVGVALQSGETPVTTLETYNLNGRLIAVTEGENTPLQLTTNYGYDVGDRLTSVYMAGGTQSRTFYYDLRGFLQWEIHPELGANGGGTARYGSYDPHGHIGRKVNGLDNSLFDVSMSYDSAERLVAVNDLGTAQRPLKRFTYADGNNGAELRNGKLLTATRYNHLTTGDFTVSENYQYDSSGRASQRQTVVQTNGNTVQSFTQRFNYEPFGAASQIDYPTCDAGAACGGNVPGAVPYIRSRGFLTGVSSYAPAISYNVDGSLHQVVHGTSPQITDTYEPETSGMPRPGLITFSGFQSCTAPTASVGAGGTIQPGGSFDIPVTLTGTAPWNITWSDGYVQNGVTTGTFSRHVTPSATTTYFISSVTDANCSGTSSGSATVTVSCTAPTATVSGGGTVVPGNSAQIQATLTGTSPWSLTWSDGNSQSGITTSTVTRTVTPSSTTTYTITSVSDAHCSGTSSGSATVTVSLNAPTGFVATTVTGGTSQVSMHWNAVSGAGWYQVERATVVNGAYAPVGGHVTTTAVTHTLGDTVPTTYLYRVRSGATFGGVDTTSNPSGIDYATVAPTLFIDDPLVAGATAIKGMHIGELRKAIDAVRRAANLNPAWTSYAPATGVVTSADNTVARQKLDEAVGILVGHSVFYSGETPAVSGRVWAYQLQQIRDGVK